MLKRMKKVSEILRDIVKSGKKPGNVANMDMNIEGEMIVRDKAGKIKQKVKIKKKRLFS